MATDYEMKGYISPAKRTNDKQPTHRGKVTIAGKEWSLSGWEREGKYGTYISLTVSEPRERQGEGDGERRESGPESGAGAKGSAPTSSGRRW